MDRLKILLDHTAPIVKLTEYKINGPSNDDIMSNQITTGKAKGVLSVLLIFPKDSQYNIENIIPLSLLCTQSLCLHFLFT